MFYGADQVDRVLKCASCEKKLANEVRLVPECGRFICGKCHADAREEAAETGQYKCEACQEMHWMPENGLADCKQLLPLLMCQPLEKPLSENAKKLKTLVKEVVEQIEKLAAFDGKEVVNEHCDRLEHDVKETVSSAIEHLSRIEEGLLREINEYRSQCLSEEEDNPNLDLEELSAEIKKFDAQWSHYFTQLDVFASEADIDDSLHRIDRFRTEMQSVERRLKDDALGGQLLIFKPNLALLQQPEAAIGSIVNLSQREMRIFETPTSTLIGDSNKIFVVLHLPSRRLASCSDDKTIKVWNLEEGKELFKLVGHTDAVYSLILLRNGLLASGSVDHTIKVWDLDQRQQVRTLRGHTDSVDSFCLLKNGNLASCSSDNTIRVWNPYLSENNLLLTLTGLGNIVAFSSIGVLSNGTLVSCSQIKTNSEEAFLRLWNPDNGKLIKEVPTGLNLARSLLVLKDDRAAVGFSGGFIGIFDLARNDANSVTKYRAHDSSVYALVQLSNGHVISCGSMKIRVWTLPEFGLLQTIHTGHLQNVLSLSISPNERSLASASVENSIKLWAITKIAQPSP